MGTNQSKEGYALSGNSLAEEKQGGESRIEASSQFSSLQPNMFVPDLSMFEGHQELNGSYPNKIYESNEDNDQA